MYGTPVGISNPPLTSAKSAHADETAREFVGLITVTIVATRIDTKYEGLSLMPLNIVPLTRCHHPKTSKERVKKSPLREKVWLRKRWRPATASKKDYFKSA
jgi:hypothetical protein